MSIEYILIAVALFFVAGPLLVEIIGYVWHRFGEHEGKLGKRAQKEHYVHHEEAYPAENLRPMPGDEYKNGKEWSWHILAWITLAILFLIMPWQYALPFALGAILYAWYVVSYFHKAFHLANHPFQKYAWFRRLVKLHDIHHYGLYNYGIVFFFFDRMFGTLRTEFPAQKEDVFPGLTKPN